MEEKSFFQIFIGFRKKTRRAEHKKNQILPAQTGDALGTIRRDPYHIPW
jgi:hypothetical protein